jgi:molybdopterin molybdotransferase
MSRSPDLLSPAAARAAVLATARPLPVVELPLAEALGLGLAQDVCADRDLPAADRSARDGFAVRAADLQAVPATLRLVGEVAAGSASQPEVGPGTCASIYTGGNVPPGADAVVMLETTTRGEPDGTVTFTETPRAGQHIMHRGEDARQGEVLLRPGCRLTPGRVAVLVTVGQDPVRVHRRIVAAVLCTGRELRTARQPVAPHEIRNSNGPGLQAALREDGAVEALDLGVVTDELPPLQRAIATALERVDVLLCTGGVSVGAYDLVPAAVTAAGCETVFHKVAAKPGKPALLARGPRGQLIFGLPGNPLSSFTSFHNLVRPALDVLVGGDGGDPPVWRVRSTVPLRGKGERTSYVQARLEGPAADGVWQASPVPGLSSGNVVAGGAADGTLVVPPDLEVTAGNLVDFVPWRRRW